jgi:hypothetical protein
MSNSQGLTLAYVASLVGGLILLLVSLVNAVWFGSGAPAWGGFGTFMQGMMGSNHNFMRNYAASPGFFAAVSVVSLVCGVIVLVGAIMLRVYPKDHLVWGVVILVFSAVSFVGMGGYFIGAVLGIVGAVLAITYRQI